MRAFSTARMSLAVDGEYIGAVHHDALEAVRGPPIGEMLTGVLEPVGGRVCELVVVDHVHDRQLSHARQVHRLVHVAAGRGAVATPAQCDPILVPQLKRERNPGDHGDHRRQVADAREQAHTRPEVV